MPDKWSAEAAEAVVASEVTAVTEVIAVTEEVMAVVAEVIIARRLDITAVVVDVDSILVLLPVPALMELPLDTAGINFLPLFAVVFDSADCSPLVAVGEGISLDRRDTVVGAILPAVDPCTLFF